MPVFVYLLGIFDNLFTGTRCMEKERVPAPPIEEGNVRLHHMNRRNAFVYDLVFGKNPFGGS